MAQSDVQQFYMRTIRAKTYATLMASERYGEGINRKHQVELTITNNSQFCDRLICKSNS